MNDNIITSDTLEEYGISISPEEQPTLLDHLNETLSERIGAEVTEQLDDDQLAELLVTQEGSGKNMNAWLSERIPDLKEIIQDEVDILIGELAENANSISGTL